MLRQFENVRRPFAQRWNFQIHNVQAKQQILPECAVAHRVREIPVGCRDDANVDRHGLGAADAIDHALLNGAQQLGLQPHVHFRDFVQ